MVYECARCDSKGAGVWEVLIRCRQLGDDSSGALTFGTALSGECQAPTSRQHPGSKQATSPTRPTNDFPEHSALHETGRYCEFEIPNTAHPARRTNYGRHQDDHRAVLRKLPSGA